MEEKYNNATPQRPSGHRALDSRVLSVDLPKYVDEIKNEAAYHENGKNAMTVFKSEHATITLVALKSGEKIQSGIEEQHLLLSLYMINGSLSFYAHDKEEYLSEGQLLNFHYEQSFYAVANTDCVCLLNVIK